MDAQQIKLVQASYAKVVPIAGTAAALFYSRLFKLDPELEPLFKSNLSEQRIKLMRMMTMAVNGLDNLEALLLLVRSIGVRHIDYGVKDVDYDTFGAALFWTLEQGLREEFTPELREAWEQAYGVLAGAMRKADKD
jgi:hemoglobin-like flavoprotein